jgi:uncharacterized damage-inducible protein DinB/predicted RNase H-like HicB family nuclease
MVHVPALAGCMANGPTTEDALEATPGAIRAFLRFMRRAGEDVDPEAPFTTRVQEHVTEGIWLGNGSPYVTFGPDLEPLTEADVATLAERLRRLRQEIAAWAKTQDTAALDHTVEGSSRSARAILLHVLGPTGAYLSPVLGTISGISALQTAAERGQVPIAEALNQSTAKVVERLQQPTADERSKVVQRPKEIRTLRKALRRTLEHDWEHLAELSRRPGGPEL